MKKPIAIVLISVIILLFTSCKKDPSNGAYGSWTVNNTTYPATVFYDNVLGSPGTLVIPNSAGASSSNAVRAMNIIFYDSIPTSSGIYSVISDSNTLATPGQVQIWSGGNLQSEFYGSTGVGNNQNIAVTISGGKLTLTGTNINMTGPSGNCSLSFNVHQ
jgi:hypothetical protein